MDAHFSLHRLLYAPLLGALLGVSLESWARRACADDSPASKLFDEGRALVVAGRFAEACPKLEQSQRLEPRLGTQLNVAFCHEREGKLATAWLGFQEARLTARRTGDAAREEFARSRIEALEPRVPWLRVRADGGTDSEQLTLLLDGAPLAASSWGKELPVDPGEHALVAARVGEEYWRTSVAIGEAQHVDISVPAPPPSATPRAPSDTPGQGAAGAEVMPPRAADASALGRFVYEIGAFAGLIVVDTRDSTPDGNPARIESNDALGMDETLRCSSSPCEYFSLGSTSGLVAGVMGYVGYTVAPRISVGGRLLLGARIEGGTLFALGPSVSFPLGERVQLAPAVLFGIASHAAAGEVGLQSSTSYSIVDERLRGTTGLSVGLGAALDHGVLQTAHGELVLQATPLLLYGENGMAYALPLGAAYRWN